MPFGSQTFQRRSVLSTLRTIVASLCSWSIGLSINRQSGPICATERQSPFTSRRMFTTAEWAPLLIPGGMTDEILAQRLSEYVSRHQLRLEAGLGSGIHGIVFSATGNLEVGATAIKIHRHPEFYRSELAVYQRLQEAGVRRILEFNVPRLVRFADDLQVIEMDIVSKPYVLDFAGAHLDIRPQFTEEQWAGWEADRKEKFENHWQKVLDVLDALKEFGIYMIDASPGNIGFP